MLVPGGSLMIEMLKVAKKLIIKFIRKDVVIDQC